MHTQVLTKADGRQLRLYSRTPIPPGLPAPSPNVAPSLPNAHLRWHPLLGEWIVYAEHRQHRTFLPPAEYNPLAPSSDPANPTELPEGPYDVAVFDNLFPSLTMGASAPPELIVPSRPGYGVCEVVVFTQNPETSLGQLPLSHLMLIVEVWAERYRELGRRKEIQYVFPFENRGVEVGVTLHHPHGQIYGYPFVPPVAERELWHQRQFYEQHGRGLLADLMDREIRDNRRMLYLGEAAAAFIPVCARFPYEVWVAPRRPAASFADLSSDECRDFAGALKTVLQKFDGLWGRPFPYVLAFHQAPTDGRPHPESHLHGEFYPALRMKGRLKHLAGSELGAGVFTADTLPEEKAAELRAVAIDPIDWNA